MARKRQDTSRSGLGKVLGIFLLVNILPIGAGVWLLIRHLQGDLPPIDLPEGAARNGIVLGAFLVALILVGSLSLPAAHRAFKAVRRQLRYRAEVLAGRQPGSRVLSLLVIPPAALVWFVAYLLRMILIVVSLALIAGCVVFMIRLINPEFMEDAIQWVIAWRP